jgi:hypothetical protein
MWALAAWAQSATPTGIAPGRLSLLEAMLSAAEGDSERAIQSLLLLSNGLQPTDPALAEALFWLGLEQYGAGRFDEARDALTRGARTGTCFQCRDLLEQLEVDTRSIHELPVVMTFDTPEHPVFHPWRVQDLGSLDVSTDAGSDLELVWTTTLRLAEPDRLMIGLRDPTPAPTFFAVDVLSHQQSALLDLVVEDAHGRQYGLPQPQEVAVGFPTRISADLTRLVPLEPGPPLDPQRIVLLWIVDRTGRRSSGTNRFWLDDLEIR